MAGYWGGGTGTSSDGMRVIVSVKAANADYNARYFGNQRGLTFLTHTADIQMPLSPRIISTNEREALYTIDLLNNHETDLNIVEHYTDTAGYTFHVFAACAFLGYRFAPSIRSMTNQFLYSVEPMLVEGPFAQIYKGTADVDLIEELWDEAQRFMASIRHGTASAALMMRKLASYPRQNRLAQALYEMGQLERTLFILDYLADESLRKRVRAGLNKGELLHALARALFFGQRGELRERNFEDQLHRASCLMLLIGMISTWNSVYLQKSWETAQIENPGISDEYLPFVSPLRWDHINVLGQYHIDAASPWSLENLRPLRSLRKYQTVDDPEQP
jgi:TnpA family transposase